MKRLGRMSSGLIPSRCMFCSTPYATSHFRQRMQLATVHKGEDEGAPETQSRANTRNLNADPEAAQNKAAVFVWSNFLGGKTNSAILKF